MATTKPNTSLSAGDDGTTKPSLETHCAATRNNFPSCQTKVIDLFKLFRVRTRKPHRKHVPTALPIPNLHSSLPESHPLSHPPPCTPGPSRYHPSVPRYGCRSRRGCRNQDGIQVVFGRPLGVQSLVLAPVPVRWCARLSRHPEAARPERAPRQVQQRNAEALEHFCTNFSLNMPIATKGRRGADGAQCEARFDVHEVNGGCGDDWRGSCYCSEEYATAGVGMESAYNLDLPSWRIGLYEGRVSADTISNREFLSPNSSTTATMTIRAIDAATALKRC
jgi:hypothetical protein